MRHRRIQFAACLAALLLLGACQGTYEPLSSRDRGLLIDREGQSRSLALTTQTVQSAQLLPPGFDTWYASRNDRVPYVISGYESSIIQSSVTYTRDSQNTVNGRVFDNYNQTTYRRSYQESIR